MQFDMFNTCSPESGFFTEELPSPECPLSLLSLGMGQDSVTLLNLYINSEAFRKVYAPGRFLVLFSDTGNEHKMTYEYERHVKALCEEHGIEYYMITNDMGFHTPAWMSLIGQFRRNNTIGSVTYKSKSCTINLKINPIYKFLESWLGRNYGVTVHNKRGLKEFEAKYGKINVIVGIASGEEKRCAKPEAEPKDKWKLCLNMTYPLVDMGLDRAGCQNYLRSVNQPIPYPSNCRFCHFLSRQELLWMHRFDHAGYEEWVKLEADKFEEWAPKIEAKYAEEVRVAVVEGMSEKEIKKIKKDGNHGVFGAKLLPEVLAETIKEFGHWSDERLDEYKMSHGHCVMSQY